MGAGLVESCSESYAVGRLNFAADVVLRSAGSLAMVGTRTAEGSQILVRCRDDFVWETVLLVSPFARAWSTEYSGSFAARTDLVAASTSLVVVSGAVAVPSSKRD